MFSVASESFQETLLHDFSTKCDFYDGRVFDGGGARCLASAGGVMTASEFEKLYRSPAASLVSSPLPLISPVCCLEYGSPIGVTAQADSKPYSSITAKQGAFFRVFFVFLKRRLQKGGSQARQVTVGTIHNLTVKEEI